MEIGVFNVDGLNLAYDRFIKSAPIEVSSITTDLIGINLSCRGDLCFKAYYDDHHSMTDPWGIMYAFEKSGFVRYFQNVYKTDKYDYKIDIALKNRTDRNMMEVFDCIRHYCHWSRIHQQKICDLLVLLKPVLHAENKLAPLYHICFSGYPSSVEKVTYYILLRACTDFEKPYKDFYCPNIEAVKQLKIYNDTIFNLNLEFAEKMLKSDCNTKLWMLGIDTAQDGSVKFKLYFEIPHDIHTKVVSCYDKDLANGLDVLKEWETEQRNVRSYAAAFSFDGRSSAANVYYEWEV